VRGETFKTGRDAAKKLALAFGIKGAAGGWLYKPRAEHLGISGGGDVPAEWAGCHLYQGWWRFEGRYGSWIAENEDGRYYIAGAERIYDANRAESGKVYAKFLDALADGREAEAETLKARHEGYKLRVFAAYDLAYGKVKMRA
jgi:hypothetical protein